jgi:hypothetical protein
MTISRPPVMVSAPARSNRSLLRAAPGSGDRNTTAIAASNMPIGTLIKNTQRQPGPSVIRPLATTPTDPEIPAVAP